MFNEIDTKIDTASSVDTPADIDIEELVQTLKLVQNVTQNMIQELEQLKGTIISHRGAVLKAKTSGTTITTLGTGLAVTGLILAPFTLGTSLIISGIGAVTSIGGAATNMIADLVDRNKRKKYLQNIQDLSADQQTSKLELSQMLFNLQQLIDPFLAQGLSKSEAIYAILITRDFPNDSPPTHEMDEEFEFIQDAESWKPIRRFAFKAGIQSFKLVKSSHALSALTIATRSGASAMSNVSVSVGRLLGTAVFKTTMATVGVIFTGIDIAMLVTEWKASDPTQETVNFVIEEFKQEVEQMMELEDLLEVVKKTQFFKIQINKRNLTVVGSSPFSTRAMAGLLSGKVEVMEGFYGKVGNCGAIDGADDEWSREFWVGELDLNSCDLLEDDKDDGDAKPITSISQIFPPQNNHNLLKINVIDQSILKLNATVIDSFLQAQNLPSFKELEPSLRKRDSIVKDYYEPLSQNMVLNINQVCVAYIKCSSGYMNSNKWEYNFVLKMILKQGLSYFCKSFEKFKKSEKNGDIDSDSELEKDLNSDQMEDLVHILVNHKSFLDPVASSVWCGGGDNERNLKLLGEVVSSVETLFRSLRFKIPMWACEMWEVMMVVNKN